MIVQKYLTKPLLLDAARAAKRAGKERSIDDEMILELPHDARVIVRFATISDAGDMRCHLQLPGGKQAWIDVTMIGFKALPEIKA